MAEFNRVEAAKVSPTECVFCSTFEGPFIDTGIDKLEGRLYVCVSRYETTGEVARRGCVEQMGLAAGTMMDRHEFDAVNEDRTVLQARLRELEGELDHAKLAGLDVGELSDALAERLVASGIFGPGPKPKQQKGKAPTAESATT